MCVKHGAGLTAGRVPLFAPSGPGRHAPMVRTSELQSVQPWVILSVDIWSEGTPSSATCNIASVINKVMAWTFHWTCRSPPGVPPTIHGRPSRQSILLLSARIVFLPGATTLACPGQSFKSIALPIRCFLNPLDISLRVSDSPLLSFGCGFAALRPLRLPLFLEGIVAVMPLNPITPASRSFGAQAAPGVFRSRSSLQLQAPLIEVGHQRRLAAHRRRARRRRVCRSAGQSQILLPFAALGADLQRARADPPRSNASRVCALLFGRDRLSRSVPLGG